LRALRTLSPFELFDRLEQQLSRELHSAERVPAAEVHESHAASGFGGSIDG
jgi:HSP20 family protein